MIYNILIPAYGRAYATTADMLKDWHNGKDFKEYTSQRYCSIRDEKVLKADSLGIVLCDIRNNLNVKVWER